MMPRAQALWEPRRTLDLCDSYASQSWGETYLRKAGFRVVRVLAMEKRFATKKFFRWLLVNILSSS